MLVVWIQIDQENIPHILTYDLRLLNSLDFPKLLVEHKPTFPIFAGIGAIPGVETKQTGLRSEWGVLASPTMPLGSRGALHRETTKLELP